MTRSKNDVTNIAQAIRLILYNIVVPAAFVTFQTFWSFTAVWGGVTADDPWYTKLSGGVLDFVVAMCVGWVAAEVDAFIFRYRASMIWDDAWTIVDMKPEGRLSRPNANDYVLAALVTIVFPLVTSVLFVVFGIGNGWGWFSLTATLIFILVCMILYSGGDNNAGRTFGSGISRH